MRSWFQRFRLLTFLAMLMPLSGSQSFSRDLVAQTPIVLRDLSLIRDKSIVDFTETSISLSDGSKLGWDQVLKASVEPARQQEFDRQVKEIGLPLFRLKTRIEKGDWVGAGKIAQPIYASTVAKGKTVIDADTTYLVCLATMQANIREEKRVEALLPFFRAAELQPKIDKEVRDIAGFGIIPERDRQLKLSREIIPVWFDASELDSTATQLEALIRNRQPETVNSLRTNQLPAPGAILYLASMKIELGDTDEALRLLRSLNSNEDLELAGWRIVLEARIHQKTKNALNAQTMLETSADKFVGSARPAALYYRGINVIEQADPSDIDRSKAILTLLRIPALFGDDHPDLAAAAIYQAAEVAELRGSADDQQKLRDELLRRYPRTYHGRLERGARSGR